ncbi:MAG: hypothetical protein ACKO2L_05470, partial [Planctomycetaceae bacterium]
SILAKIGPNPPSPRSGERGARCSFHKKVNAIGRQPAGKGPRHRPANALASKRTFGAKHSHWAPAQPLSRIVEELPDFCIPRGRFSFAAASRASRRKVITDASENWSYRLKCVFGWHPTVSTRLPRP